MKILILKIVIFTEINQTYDKPEKNDNSRSHGIFMNTLKDNEELEMVLSLIDRYGFVNDSCFIYLNDHGITGKYNG